MYFVLPFGVHSNFYIDVCIQININVCDLDVLLLSLLLLLLPSCSCCCFFDISFESDSLVITRNLVPVAVYCHTFCQHNYFYSDWLFGDRKNLSIWLKFSVLFIDASFYELIVNLTTFFCDFFNEILLFDRISDWIEISWMKQMQLHLKTCCSLKNGKLSHIQPSHWMKNV